MTNENPSGGAMRPPATSEFEAKQIVIQAMRRAHIGLGDHTAGHLDALLDGFAADIRWIDGRPDRVLNRALGGPPDEEIERGERERRVLAEALDTTRKDVENGFRRSRLREIVQKMGRELADKIVDEVFGPSPK